MISYVFGFYIYIFDTLATNLYILLDCKFILELIINDINILNIKTLMNLYKALNTIGYMIYS